MTRRIKYIAIILLLIILTSLLFVGINNEKSLKKAVNENSIYLNDIEGYTYNIPEGYLLDENFYPYAVRFVSDDCIIEIYSEKCQDSQEISSYINYTNSAIISNKVDYFGVKQSRYRRANILLWSRSKLSKIENDKNHYLKIDIPKRKRVYTVLVKSTSEISDYKQYIEALTIIKPSKNEYPEPKIKCAANRKFNSETEKFYNQYLKNQKGTEWGIYQYDYMETDELSKIENQINHKFRLLLLYTEFNEVYDPALVKGFLDKAYSDGRFVEVTLQPKKYHQKGNELFRVLDGYYDEFLHDYAKDIASFKHPVLFRLANEMNGDWCEYSGYQMSLDTELYREMYRYIYEIFRKHNADNVIWIWNPNGESFPDFRWNSEAMYYPGDSYVDALGLTLYNTGTFYEGEEWKEFYELYNPLYKKAMKNYDMPFMITEFSCARKGGNKEEWTRKMLSEIEMFPNIKFAVWWNSADFTQEGQISRAYYINDSEAMCEIFKEYFKNRN